MTAPNGTVPNARTHDRRATRFFRAHPAWRRLFVLGRGLGVAFVVFVLVLEVSLRIVLPQHLNWDTALVWEPVEGLGRQRKADVDVNVDTGEGEIRVIFDASRHRQAATPSTRGQINILAMGDSFVEALQVPAEQTMTALLGTALSKQSGRQVSVTNAGVGGWDPNQYRIAVQDELKRAAYDLVLVFVYMENDVIDRRVESFPPETRLTSPPARYGSLAEAFQTVTVQGHAWLQQYSHGFVFSRNLLELQRMRSGVRTMYFMPNVMRSAPDASRWRVTGGVLAEIAANARLHDSPVLYVLLPPPYYVNERLLAHNGWLMGLDMSQVDVGQPARLLLAELTSHGLEAVDATSALRAAFEAGAGELYGRIDPHFSPVGHQVMARFLTPLVMQHLHPP